MGAHLPPKGVRYIVFVPAYAPVAYFADEEGGSFVLRQGTGHCRIGPYAVLAPREPRLVVVRGGEQDIQVSHPHQPLHCAPEVLRIPTDKHQVNPFVLP